MFEKLKFDQLFSVFTPVFSNNMLGFLREHSCCSALFKLTHGWCQALDNKKDVAVVAIDLSKAFDSIWHNLLLAKLEAYGVHDSAISWSSHIYQAAFKEHKCNGKVSDWLPLRFGVPYGSLLGPLFLNIFVNDVNYSAGSSSQRLYADYTTQQITHQSPCTLECTLNEDREINPLVHCKLPASKRY